MIPGAESRPASVRRLASVLHRTPFHPQWLMPERVVSTAISKCRGRLLDVGSADGWLSGIIADSASYISLDFPPTALGLYGTRPHVFADACRMPFVDESIDAVACYEVLEHVRQPGALLAEVSRILVPGGVVELTMPFFYPLHDEPHDFQRWTRHGWVVGLKAAGLTPEVIEPRSSAVHSAAVAMCLSLAGPLQHGSVVKLLVALPVLLFAIPVVNLSAWILGAVWPPWGAMPIGYRVLARKPG